MFSRTTGVAMLAILFATGWELQRSVVFPAALPAYMAGVQQAWGFAWKALMAGELIVPATGANGLGHLLDRSQEDVASLLAVLDPQVRELLGQ